MNVMAWYHIAYELDISESRGREEMQPKIFKYRWNCCFDTGFLSFNGSGYAAGAILGCKGSDITIACPHLAAASTTGRGYTSEWDRIVLHHLAYFWLKGSGSRVRRQGRQDQSVNAKCAMISQR